MQKRQLPGRQEALRAVLTNGDSSPEMRHIAGLDLPIQRQPAGPMPSTFTFTSGIELLTKEQRAALPF